MYEVYAVKTIKEVDDVTGTARYVDARRQLANYSFYLAANESYPYYSWGIESQWRDWLGFFTKPNQHAEIIDPEKISESHFETPFTLFMSDNLWQVNESMFRINYPGLKLHPIKPDASLLAIEVL